jgi:hypothetical protein
MAEVSKGKATQPNIVFILWDNLGWGEVGCYGGGVLRGAATPWIDELAAQVSESAKPVESRGRLGWSFLCVKYRRKGYAK